MELNPDFINIQGILIDLEKSVGELKKIRYKSGNEEKLSKILLEFQKILSIKKYIQDGYVNEIFDKELESFVLFIVLNTEFDTNFEKDEYSHLTNITPQLSKCLLCNLIVELDLMKYFSRIFEEFSLDLIVEILDEMIVALEKRNPHVYLKNSFELLQLIIVKLSKIPLLKDTEEQCEKLYEIIRIILLNYTCMQDNQLTNIKKTSIYKQMGFNIYKVLLLLMKCNPENPLHLQIIDRLAQTGCSIMMAVTLDVYCCWAEIDINEQILQKLISENAYQFIEKYTKYDIAKELVNIVKNIAQKPKTLKEIIQEADQQTIITMIDKCDENQKQWFQMLLNKSILNDKQALRCIEHWVSLCGPDDVVRLLNLTVNSSTKDEEIKRLIIKCASVLNCNDLIKISLAHFHRNGVKYVFNDNIEQDLILFFNKLKNIGDNNQEFSKELYLLLLQNPEKVFSFIYNQCLKNSFYTSTLNDILKIISNIGRIDDLALNILHQEIDKNQINEQNIRNYTLLLNRLILFNFFTIDQFIKTIILPILKTAMVEKNYRLLESWLEILNFLDTVTITKQNIEFLTILFDIMRDYRCLFVEFDSDRQEILKLIIDLLNKYEISSEIVHEDIILPKDDNFGVFYRDKLFKNTENLLQFMYPDCNLDDHAETVSYMIKILPRCVTHEWLSICHLFYERFNIQKTVELFADYLVVLCHFVKSQETITKEVQCMLNGLKYCLRNFGFVLQELQSKCKNMPDLSSLAKNVCRLLVDIPYDRIKNDDALFLVCIISDNAFKYLKNDKQYVCYISNIQDIQVKQLLQR